MKPTQKELQHLFLRAGFGLKPTQLQEYEGKSIEKILNIIFKQAENYTNFDFIKIDEDEIKPKLLPRNEKKLLRKERKEEIKTLNIKWLEKMQDNNNQLREKMTYFWHTHFACKSANAVFNQLQNNTLRTHALGNFKDLLMAVAKDPSMLQFLNNQQNRKEKPNENFARELMELFTLGRGNYTENDVKSAARAFTGWGIEKGEAKFKFRERQHDFGEKTFMGQKGTFSGEDILNIILKKPETAFFITKKIYIFFVNDTPNISDEKILKQLANDFYKADYDISKLMRDIFSAKWFYDEKNIGTKIKSPIELLIGLKRTFEVDFIDENANLFVQKILGQMLLNPPNVAGWAGGRAFIDSSSLLFRLQLTQVLFNQAVVEIDNKEEGDDNAQKYNKKNKQPLQATLNLKAFDVFFEENISKKSNETSNKILAENIKKYLIQDDGNLNKTAFEDILKGSLSATKVEFIKKIVLYLTALPEYQMQ